MTTFLAQGDPAGGAAIAEVVLATAGASLATALLFALGFGHRAGKTQLLHRASAFAGRIGGLPAWVALPSAHRHRLADHGAARHVLGHLAAHRQRPRRRPARQPGALPDPVRPVRHLHRRLPRDGDPEGEAVPDRDPALRRLARAARRRADGGLRRLRADRLPARRRLAPPVRPGRDAVGPDAPDADRRRLAVARRPGRAARRGHPLAAPPARGRERGLLAAPRGARPAAS